MFKPEAIFFDLDGLLLDTEPLHGKAWSRTAKSLGEELTSTQLLALRGQRRVECARQIDNWLNDPVGQEKILELHKPISKSLLQNSKAMPGAEQLVKMCFKKDLPMALVSSSASESVAYKTSSHLWIELIETRVLGDDKMLKEGKPSPAPFLLAAKKLNLNPKKCWVLEDSIAGQKSGLAAGCQVLILTERDVVNSNLRESTNLTNPTYINSLYEAIERLKEIL